MVVKWELTPARRKRLREVANNVTEYLCDKQKLTPLEVLVVLHNLKETFVETVAVMLNEGLYAELQIRKPEPPHH